MNRKKHFQNSQEMPAAGKAQGCDSRRISAVGESILPERSAGKISREQALGKASS